MKIAGFLRQLKQATADLGLLGRWVEYEESKPNGLCLRFYHNDYRLALCPIAFLAYAKEGDVVSSGSYEVYWRLAKEMRLNARDAHLLTYAADGREKHAKLNKRLKRAVGL